jgi:hypothetical protein
MFLTKHFLRIISSKKRVFLLSAEEEVFWKWHYRLKKLIRKRLGQYISMVVEGASLLKEFWEVLFGFRITTWMLT